jgi:2-polyprenyl-3-methyl-5-hydroxy-6-metoxy-1,4-benzoquinol methylase
METQAVQECPINGNVGVEVYSRVTDHYFGTSGDWSYFKDFATGHLWLNPRPADSALAAIYSRYYTHKAGLELGATLMQRAHSVARHRELGYPEGGHAGLLARMLSLIPTVASAGSMDVLKLPSGITGRMLDFGCGDGSFMRRMQGVGWDVHGVEPDTLAVDTLRSRYDLDVRLALGDYSKTGERFNVITLNHVIEHLPDPVGTLKELKVLLAPGGMLIVTTPNANCLGAKVFGKVWRGLEPPRHFNVFTKASMECAIRSAGLTVQSLTTETRLARRLFWTSFLATLGHREIELAPRSEKLIKWCGYAFQILEDISNSLAGTLGEELYCRATAA